MVFKFEISQVCITDLECSAPELYVWLCTWKIFECAPADSTLQPLEGCCPGNPALFPHLSGPSILIEDTSKYIMQVCSIEWRAQRSSKELTPGRLVNRCRAFLHSSLITLTLFVTESWRPRRFSFSFCRVACHKYAPVCVWKAEGGGKLAGHLSFSVPC